MRTALSRCGLRPAAPTCSACVARRGRFAPRAPARAPSAALREPSAQEADAASTSGSAAPAGPALPFAAGAALLLLSEAAPAWAGEAGASPFEGVTANSVALVLSILFPSVGNWWYGLTAVSPLSAVYYYQKGERAEEVRVKMVTADDDMTTDIVVEGDQEEIARMAKELGLVEKGMVYVKGILEQ
ncbi:hypothetical protein Rsub_03615 [Raphidocelis subcapitata]|uniref:Uncharacterized protein n=1 Tax=Raphidocelis subcapitata TaxID=307507 RepID=A0A2V0P2I6_9CHLO|nr:hypothetical protein Rsub_03615 [Raphidocelis subcapitata]|eukprot:GBF91295.1 hypothetical protein Rsub_03615 [Raphidocelis subcapitata]